MQSISLETKRIARHAITYVELNLVCWRKH